MPTAVLIWIWSCAYLNCAGWALSAMHQLNAGGYAIALAIWFAALLFWKCRAKAAKESKVEIPSLRTRFFGRFRKPFPLAFLTLAAMAFLGGAIYAPSNYDGLAYRVPRILHWLAAGQWHWIHTNFPRVNQRACGFEWVSAPFIALMNTDRWLFLINIVSLLLLPGLVFSVFTRLGVRRRAAWHWMWIAPTGCCFLLQAGSIGNDLFGAPFALAAVDFALRAKISKSPRDFFASILAAALMTSAKTSGLPLLLPWAIAILPSLKIILQRPLATAAVCAIAIFASFVPTAILNAHFCGDWTGWKAEGVPPGNPVLLAASNAGLITVQNLTPPVFPIANKWNQEVQKIIPAKLSARLHKLVAEPAAVEFQAEEMQVEETAGLGFGVTLLFFISLAAAAAKRGGTFLNLQFASSEAAWRAAIRFTPWISLLALLSQSEVYPIGRILAPFYALLPPFFLANPAHEQLVKQCWWRLSALAVFFMAAGLLVVSPARPLFPVGIFLEKIQAAEAKYPSLARVETVYSVYAARNDAFAPAKKLLPPGLKILGLVTYDDPETSLWRPFGSREINHVCPGDTAADLKARGIGYIFVKTEGFEGRFGCPPENWVARMNVQAVQKISLRLRAGEGPADWWLVKLN
jgi:hypothetical protein